MSKLLHRDDVVVFDALKGFTFTSYFLQYFISKMYLWRDREWSWEWRVLMTIRFIEIVVRQGGHKEDLSSNIKSL